MAETALKVTLLAHTPDIEKTCAIAARTCYSAMRADELTAWADEKDTGSFLENVMSSGHLSVLEHASFTFFVEGVSRSLLAQLTRHRIASFSVQSQRYVSMAGGFDYVVPPAIKALGEEAVEEYGAQMAQMADWYARWQEKLGGGPSADDHDIIESAAISKVANQLMQLKGINASFVIGSLATTETERLKSCASAYHQHP